jgi:hypothetical protein
MRNAATAYASSVRTDVAAYEDLPGHHLLAVRNLIASTNDVSYHGSASELPPATSHGYAEWDFFDVSDPVMFQRFLDAVDYWFDYSDTSSAGSHDLHATALWSPSVTRSTAQARQEQVTENPPETQGRVRPGTRWAEHAPTSPTGGADINAQLAQARKLKAKIAEEYHAVRLLRASITGEASARGERVRKMGKQAYERINVDFNVDDPSTPPRASQKLVTAATLLRAVPALSSPEARILHHEAQALIEQAAIQQAESSTSRMRQPGSVRDYGNTQGSEASAHADGAAGQPANQGRTPVRERILDTREQAQDGDACNVINARRAGNTKTRAVVGYYPRWGGRYDSREDRTPTPEPPGTRVFCREFRTASFPQRFRQPTSINKYTGETDPRV